MTERIKEIRGDLRTIHQYQSESAAEQMADTLVGHVKFLLAEVARLTRDIDECWVPLYHGSQRDLHAAEAEVERLRAKVARVEAQVEEWERIAAQSGYSQMRDWAAVHAVQIRAALAEPERDEEGGND